MKLHIAVCDDEAAEIDYLRSLVSAWARERQYALSLDGFPGAEAFLFAYEADQSYDILLLDIQMKRLDGVALARQIRAVNREIPIIFITGYMDYISDGYDVEALHYLLKPATKEKLFTVLDRAADKVARNEKTLFIGGAGEKIRLPLYEIKYLEARKNYVTIRAGDDYTVKKTLVELERELDDGFFRVGRSFIVNLRYVRKVTKTDAYMSDGAAVPLPRGGYHALNRALIERL